MRIKTSIVRSTWLGLCRPSSAVDRILALTVKLLGSSLLAIRMPAALAGAITSILRRSCDLGMGGGRFAQAFTAFAVLMAPVYLGVGSFFSMNVFDQMFWTLAVYALVRAITTGEPRFWLWFGLVAGLGPAQQGQRRIPWVRRSRRTCAHAPPQVLRRRRTWLGGLVAFAVFLPHLFWQWRNDWPTLEFIRNATQYKIMPKSVLDYLLGQLVEMNPILAPIWIGGVLYGLFGRGVRVFRILSIVFLAVFALLALSGGKVYYLSPAFPPVLALGALWVEQATNAHRWIRLPAAALVALLGIAVAPIALPVLSPTTYPVYTQTLHLSAPPKNAKRRTSPCLSSWPTDWAGRRWWR